MPMKDFCVGAAAAVAVAGAVAGALSVSNEGTVATGLRGFTAWADRCDGQAGMHAPAR